MYNADVITEMIAEMIRTLNAAMYEGKIDFDVVENLMKQIGVITGFEYDILNSRVVYKDCYGKFRDAYTFYFCV